MPHSAVHHPVFARLWSIMSRHEPADIRHHRDELLAGLSGRVIEIGAGAGSNFAHYPPTVDEVVAVEPEPYLRKQAQAAAARAEVRIEVLDGVAERLPADDCSFDAAVACLVLCTVTDQARALAELRRVLLPRWRAALLRTRTVGPPRARLQPTDRRPHLLAARVRRLPHRSRHTDRDRQSRLRDRTTAPHVGQSRTDRVPGRLARHRPRAPTLTAQHRSAQALPDAGAAPMGLHLWR